MSAPNPRRFVTYRAPDGVARALELAPRLESWDKAGSRSQIELARYLDHVADVLGSVPSLGERLALELTVGLDHHVALLSGGRDLDNYLYPIVRRLGWDRFDSAFAAKLHGPSTIQIGPTSVGALDDALTWQFASVETQTSTAYAAWKSEVAQQLAGQVNEVVSAGGVELQICFRVHPRRNWAYLWKPTIDVLGVILGEDVGAHPFHPNDDRILRIGLHRVTDTELGNRVQIGMWWRATPTAFK